MSNWCWAKRRAVQLGIFQPLGRLQPQMKGRRFVKLVDLDRRRTHQSCGCCGWGFVVLLHEHQLLLSHYHDTTSIRWTHGLWVKHDIGQMCLFWCSWLGPGVAYVVTRGHTMRFTTTMQSLTGLRWWAGLLTLLLRWMILYLEFICWVAETKVDLVIGVGVESFAEDAGCHGKTFACTLVGWGCLCVVGYGLVLRPIERTRVEFNLLSAHLWKLPCERLCKGSSSGRLQGSLFHQLRLSK